MKNYIGTKLVQAEPASHEGGKVYLRTDGILKTMATVEEGYKVVYEDGYEIWLPKDVFEKAYNVADTPLARMYIERDELADRLNTLTAFLNRGDAELIVCEKQLKLMEWQEIHMHGYLKALNDRIALAENRI